MKRAALLTLICILLCIFVAFAASAIVSRAVFDRLPHLEDEFAYLYQARIFARGQTHIATPTPVRAYWQPFLINVNGHRFGKYPPGWPLVLAAGDWTGQEWVISAWLAMLSVALVYRLGREIFNPQTGAVAALLTATSPAALLLNGTLMGHTAALCFTLVCMYALWRIERGRRALLWGVIAGAALGLVLITRPLTAVGVALPFALYYAARIAWAGLKQAARDRLLQPLLVLAGVTLGVGLLWPAFNYRVSAPPGESFPSYLARFLAGDKDTNLYRYIWDYDRIGFGEGHGRVKGGHTPALGWRHAKQDLGCAARDLFGWAAPARSGVTVEDNACLKTGRGYSWLLLPFGFLMTVYRRWTWLLLGIPVGLVAAYITYWIGGAVYSARYYYEALGAVALISAAGLTELARLAGIGWRRIGGPARLAPPHVLYAALIGVTLYSLAVYSPARLEPLRGYGRISRAQIEQVNALRRKPDKPVVVIVWGEHHWRDIAALMAVTSPYLDSEIVLARDPDEWDLPALLDRWPDREKLYYIKGVWSYDPPPVETAAP